MKSFSYTVKDELGIHARPAGMLVKEVKNFKSKVTLENLSLKQICEIISYCVQVFEKSMVDINKKTKIIRIKLDIINNECYNLFR